jgi:hypothetical protein
VGIIRDVSERSEARRAERSLLHDLGERVEELTALPCRGQIEAARAAIGKGSTFGYKRSSRLSGTSRQPVEPAIVARTLACSVSLTISALKPAVRHGIVNG